MPPRAASTMITNSGPNTRCQRVVNPDNNSSRATNAAAPNSGPATVPAPPTSTIATNSADRVQVMYASRLVETGGVDDIFYGSRNPYTRALLDSIPDLVSDTDRLVPIPGNPPSLLNPPSGCPFRPRCSMATDTCAESVPNLTTVGDGHATRCHHADRLVHAESPANG